MVSPAVVLDTASQTLASAAGITVDATVSVLQASNVIDISGSFVNLEGAGQVDLVSADGEISLTALQGQWRLAARAP
eukprot:SAG11_NODE_1947_length_4015_cov_20.610827_7_plen_77_part_00